MLERYQSVHINENKWNIMIEFCFASITDFLGRTIGVDLNEKDHVARVNKNPRTDKPG
jgi:hypothetical protein